MVCASIAGAVRPVASTTHASTPSRSRHHPRVVAVRPVASPASHLLADGMLCKRAVGAARPMHAAAAAAAAEAVEEALGNPDVKDEAKERLEVVVKGAGGKPRLVLKFIWMEKNIGLALDQMIPGHGTVPLSPYYFWPRKDAWEELKALLESKPWISQKRMIILLNQATDIINLWQQSGAGSLQQ